MHRNRLIIQASELTNHMQTTSAAGDALGRLLLSLSSLLTSRVTRSLFCIEIDRMSYRAPLVVPALKKHTATVIMSHGLGDRSVRSFPWCGTT